MTQAKPREWVGSEVECVFWCPENPPLHSISLPPCVLSPPRTSLPPTMNPTLALQGLSRPRVTPVHHEIHQEAGKVAHGEIKELGVQPAEYLVWEWQVVRASSMQSVTKDRVPAHGGFSKSDVFMTVQQETPS